MENESGLTGERALEYLQKLVPIYQNVWSKWIRRQNNSDCRRDQKLTLQV